MSTAEDKFSVCSPLFVTWETERPLKRRIRRSPVFTFVNCEWYLELCVSVYDNDYNLHMVLTKEQQHLPKFGMKTYFFDPQKNTAPLLCRYKTFKSSSEWISYISISILEKCIPIFKVDGIFIIECIIGEVDGSTQSFKSGGQQSVQFPLGAENVLTSVECASSATVNQNFSLESLSKDFEALLENKTLPDVQLMVEETSIPCHRAVLTARSRVFAAMFLHKMTESTSGVLEIKDMDLATAEVFLKYLYSGKIPDDLTEERLMKLFEISDKYEVNALKKISSKAMMKNINRKNCLSYLSLAEAHSDQEFKDAVACYIVKDDSLITSQEWIQFSLENLSLANEVYRKYVEKKTMNKN